MGGTQTKLPSDSPWDSAEAECLLDAFSRAAGDSKKLDANGLASFCEFGPWLAERVFNSMKRVATKEKQQPGATMTLADLSKALAKSCSSSRFERREFIIDVISGGEDRISKTDVLVFLENLFTVVLPKDVAKDNSFVKRLATHTVNEAFADLTGETMTKEEAESWLSKDQGTESLLPDVLTGQFLRNNAGGLICSRRMPKLSRKSALLRDEHLWILSGHLPANCLKNPWKLLFSSTLHGKAFSRFVSKIIFKGPTVIVIRDTKGAIFGAFAPVSWHRTNKFYGEAATFLFSISPRCKIYRSSGVNSNFMYLATSLTSVTNGLGMGGQMDYWGLYIDPRLESGVCRAPCSSFGTNMPCLASEPRFDIDTVEAWGCIADYVADEAELAAAGVKRRPRKTWDAYERAHGASGLIGRRPVAKTVLDADPEMQAILEAAGRGGVSREIRIGDEAEARAEAQLRRRAAAASAAAGEGGEAAGGDEGLEDGGEEGEDDEEEYEEA